MKYILSILFICILAYPSIETTQTYYDGFEEAAQGSLTYIQSDVVRKGSHACVLTTNNQFMAGTVYNPNLHGEISNIAYKVYLNSPLKEGRISICFAFKTNGEITFWKEYFIESDLTDTLAWIPISGRYKIPDDVQYDSIDVFVWNKSFKNIYIDDLSVRFIR